MDHDWNQHSIGHLDKSIEEAEKPFARQNITAEFISELLRKVLSAGALATDSLTFSAQAEPRLQISTV